MYNLVLKVINLGTNVLSATRASKIKITNIASLTACCIAICYAIFFQFIVGSSVAAALSVVFAFIYSLSLLFSYRQYILAAKLSLFIAVMIHAFVLSTQIVTSASGFHYYYLLLPSCLFLMFDDEEKYEKFFFMALGLTLFFICENVANPTPLIDISAATEKIIFSFNILIIMLEIYLITFVFSRAITRNENLLKQMATKDWLTGLNNRGMFVELGKKLIKYARRYSKPLSLLMLDIDFFKKINDEYGHVVGDQVLKQISENLQKGIRSSDVLARYGGEEFVILLPETAIGDAFELAQNLRRSIENTPLVTEEQAPIFYTVSIGVAQIDKKIDTLNELTRCADTGLYQAKESGRNKTCLYQPNAHQTESEI